MQRFKRQAIIFTFLFSGLLFSSFAVAADQVPRKVLRVYNESALSIFDNELDRGLETVFNHMGFKMDYHDFSSGEPDIGKIQTDYAAVIVWLFDFDFIGVKAYWDWVSRLTRSGKRVILLQQPRPSSPKNIGRTEVLRMINHAMAPLGVKMGSNFSDFSPDLRITYRDPDMVEFERTLDHEIPPFYEAYSVDPRNKIYLRLRQLSTGAESASVVTSPRGGIIFGDYVYYQDPYTFKKRWRINPFKFFSECMGITVYPALDTTTKLGARLFYSHIDGDGINNSSYVRKKSYRRLTCGQVIYDDILTTYSDMPISVSVITSEIDPKFFGSKDAVALARKMFRLPNVEAASHTFTHPLIWNRTIVGPSDMENYAEQIAKNGFSNDALLAYAISGYDFHPKDEVLRSVGYINQQLLPKGKSCTMIFWSGNCMPDELTLSVAEGAKIMNINGGDGRFDNLFPSYMYLAPLYRKVGNYYQIYASFANDNLFIGDDVGYLKGEATLSTYQNIIQSFVNTESPRRMMPVNVYYHFYSGVKNASMNALKTAYRWARTQNLFQIYASDYIRVVHGFISGKVYKESGLSWRFEDIGDCRTVRFDDTALHVSLKRSRGVLGYRHFQGNLYVHLDPDQTPIVTLTQVAQRRPYVELATGDVRQFSVKNGVLAFNTTLVGKAYYKFRNLRPNTHYNIAIGAEKDVQRLDAKSTADGTLEFDVTGWGKRSVVAKRGSAKTVAKPADVKGDHLAF